MDSSKDPVFELSIRQHCEDYAKVGKGRNFYSPELFTTVVNGLSLDWSVFICPRGSDRHPAGLQIGLKPHRPFAPRVAASIILVKAKYAGRTGDGEAAWRTFKGTSSKDFVKDGEPKGWGVWMGGMREASARDVLEAKIYLEVVADILTPVLLLPVVILSSEETPFLVARLMAEVGRGGHEGRGGDWRTDWALADGEAGRGDGGGAVRGRGVAAPARGRPHPLLPLLRLQAQLRRVNVAQWGGFNVLPSASVLLDYLHFARFSSKITWTSRTLSGNWSASCSSPCSPIACPRKSPTSDHGSWFQTLLFLIYLGELKYPCTDGCRQVGSAPPSRAPAHPSQRHPTRTPVPFNRLRD